MSRDEVLDCTPRYLAALRHQYERNRERGEFMLAQLTAAVCNFSMGAPKKPLGVQDFMLSSLTEVVSSEPTPPMTPEQEATHKRFAADQLRNFMNFAIANMPS